MSEELRSHIRNLNKLKETNADLEDLCNAVIFLLERLEPSPDVRELGESGEQELSVRSVPYIPRFEDWTWQLKLLHLFVWADANYSRGGLTSTEIVRILHERFGMETVGETEVNTTKVRLEISRNLFPQYLTREKENGRNRYYITEQGLQLYGESIS